MKFGQQLKTGIWYFGLLFLICPHPRTCLASGAVSVNLDFSAAIPATVNDTNGLGVGFTTRLPGTGGSLLWHDTNLDLSANPGMLQMTTTHANLGGLGFPADLVNAEAPGVFVPDVGVGDITIESGFRDVQVLNGSDQMMVYAAISATANIRAGIHQQNRFILCVNDGTGDVNVFSDAAAFSTGDDIDISLSRSAGLWTVSWHNLTTQTSGSLPGVSVPWLDVQPDLYFGIHAANPGTATSFVANFDSFSLVIVPEPPTVILGGAGALVLALTVLRNDRRRN